MLGSMQEAVVCVMNWGGGVCLGVYKLEKGLFVLKVRNLILLGYIGFYIVYSWMILTAIL